MRLWINEACPFLPVYVSDCTAPPASARQRKNPSKFQDTGKPPGCQCPVYSRYCLIYNFRNLQSGLCPFFKEATTGCGDYKAA